MLRVLRARWKQGYRTVGFPDKPPTLPAMYRGRPLCDPGKCQAGCTACINACPTGAISRKGNELRVDMGRCLFCTDCADVCPAKAIDFTREYSTATRTREALVTDGRAFELAKALDGEARRLFGRSLKLREVCAGGCNACEADTNVLGTVVFDLGRFGIQFVASPRHADGLLITGPVPKNMELALKKTYEATANPKLVIAVGACAISGGVFAGNPEAGKGADAVVPVDLYIPGCPPHPITILDGLLRFLGRIQ
ncbi:MAG: NADH-quinone oxidoreductase subunit NuoB [Phycisphaerae bacterium]|nr:NADH-quinone oxidoreductase subunit NuoB [Phycisphaerae bacterium]